MEHIASALETSPLEACMMANDALTAFGRKATFGLISWMRNVLFFVICAIATATSYSMPIAGTVISAQALASYVPANSATPELIRSNTVYATVQPVEALTLNHDNNLSSSSGGIVTFAHVLTNTGNVPSRYTFSVDRSGCDTSNLGFLSTTLAVDVNGDGVLDSLDRRLLLGASGTFELAPGESATLLLQATLPLSSSIASSCLRFIATTLSSGKSAANIDTVDITSNSVVLLNKSVSYTSPVQLGSTVFTYTISAKNIGNSSATATATSASGNEIQVDGVPRPLVLIRDVLPAGTSYVAGSLHTDVFGALLLFRTSATEFNYKSTLGPADVPVEVAMGLPANLRPNTAVSMDFKVLLLSTAPLLVTNTARANFHDGSEPTESVSNLVTVKTNALPLGVSKAAGIPVSNVDANGAADGTATVRFQLVARNFGVATLYNVGILDVLEDAVDGLKKYTTSAIPASGQYTVVAKSVRLISLTGASAVADVNPDYTGQAGKAELLAVGAVLSPGGSVSVQFDVRFNVKDLPATLFNSARMHASTDPASPGTLSADSSNGLDPDANHDGAPDAPSRTPYSTQLPVLKLTKTVFPARPIAGSLGTYEMDIALKVENSSEWVAPNVRLADNLFCAFEMDKSNPTGPIASWKITTAPRSLRNVLLPSSLFTGGASCDRAAYTSVDNFASFPFDPSMGLVDGTRALPKGESDTIRFTVQVTLYPAVVGTLPTISNRAWAGALQAPSGNSSQSPGTLIWATSSTANATLVDPSGVVYNSATRQPIAGSKVTMKRVSCLATPVSSIAAAQLFGDTSIYTFNADGTVTTTTDANGAYAFIFKVPPVDDLCTYQLDAVAPTNSGLINTSNLLTARTDVFANCGAVTTVVGAPASGQDTTYYRQVKAGKRPDGSVCEVFNNNIPLDPVNTNGLILQKTASITTAEAGDLISFKLKVSNVSNLSLPQVAIKDQLPSGFRYVPGSTRVDGQRVADPSGGIGPVLIFNLPLSSATPLENGKSSTVTYQVRIGIGAAIGADAINRAWATAGVAPSALTSNEANARVRVVGGVFAKEAYAFGKVFMDCNKNGIQDESEVGIPGVRLFLEDGTGVVTDIEGKWSLYGLRPVTHALRLDTSTLPEGAQLALIEPRQSGQADSVFLDLKNGEWHKANFAVQNCENPQLLQAINARRDAIIAQPASEGEATRANTRLTPDGKSAPLSDVRGLPSAGTIDATGNLKSVTPVNSPLIVLPGAVAGEEFAAQAQGVQGALAAALPAARPQGAEAAPITTPAGETPLEDSLQGHDRKLSFLNLEEQQILPSAVRNVRVKGTLGSRLVLTLNGQVIDDKRVGKRARIESQQVEAWEYVAVQFQPGVNTLRLQELDSFGITRGSLEIQLRAPGTLSSIALDTPKTAKADERSKVPVTIRLLDAQGLPVHDRTPLTLESISARWAVTDLNPLEPGMQVMVEGGSATFDLMPPANPGDGKIRVSAGTLQSEARIIFLPDLRPLTGIGVLEGVLNVRDPGHMLKGASRAADAFEAELLGWSDKSGDLSGTARTAFYFKGAVKGEYLLTAAYDTDKTTATTMFRDIQPDQFYPIYGDSSAKTFDAQSSQRLYVRIDKDRSYLLYGDYNTASSPEVRKLSQVSRTATGLQDVYNKDDVRVSSHYSRDSLKQVIEEFPANGTSGPYRLTQSGGSDLFANSETVQLVVRDRNQPNVILSTTTLTRFVDYSIEPLAKTVLFSSPISSLDANLNPQSIRVNYVVDTGGPAFDVVGVDVQLRLSDALQLGAVAESDGAPDNNRQLVAATALAKLDDKTLLSAEVVGTHSDLKGKGQGVGLELRHDDKLLKYKLNVQVSDAGFDNPSAGIAAGHSETRGHLDYQLNESNHLKADLVYTQDNGIAGGSGTSNLVQTQGVSVAIQTTQSPNVITEVGLRAGQTDTSAATGFDYGSVAAGSPGISNPAANGVTRDTLTARARVTLKVPEVANTQVFAEAEQDVNASDRHVAAIGGNYAINDKTRLYGRYELISSLGSEFALASGVQRNVGLVGVESNYMKGGRVFDEYRIADTVDGRAMQSAMGVRNTFEVAEGLRLSGGLEQVSALPGATGTSTGESKAITGAFDWLGTGAYKNRLRGSGALEFRDGADASSSLVSLGLAYKLDADWSVLTRATVNRVSSRATDATVHWQEREQIGFAYRPVDQDVWNTLWRYEHKADIWSGDASSTFAPVNTLTDIFSAHLNYQPAQRDLMSLRVAAKQSTTTADDVRSSYGAQLLYGRWTHDINQDWDFGLQAGLLMGDGNMQQSTLGAELGYQLAKGIWVSAGYNMLGLHDPDLAGADYTDSGAYLRLRFKFDERTFSAASTAPRSEVRP
jgi:uncharacterized repeat protein (TIGR01451 family)